MVQAAMISITGTQQLEGEEPESGGTDWGSGEKLFTVSF